MSKVSSTLKKTKKGDGSAAVMESFCWGGVVFWGGGVVAGGFFVGGVWSFLRGGFGCWVGGRGGFFWGGRGFWRVVVVWGCGFLVVFFFGGVAQRVGAAGES